MCKEIKKSQTVDKRVILSTLWIFLFANYLYCDVMSLMDPIFLRALIKEGTAAGVPMNQGSLFAGTILMEIPMAMIFLSRVLKQGVNRWVNIIAGSIMTIVQFSSLFVKIPTLYYAFSSIIEIAGSIAIVWLSWKWSESYD